ncbi:hypothetical protein CPAL_08420 [Clostridium thermopalmarium DSM 5974]|uniref:Uncharacterized protein n=3 Tax=Clostridiaceae TaxID=31979 RepID=A0A151AIJ2_9CLOT|nr:hypothetical protein CLCOL_24510 [Clostridium colicanis DSM 13634]PRR74808.1 hypothetical protein CPAL_08420 [Clostridium thermopalmarium DSM 5974]PVZ15888.1 hypothetical protein LX19_02717 [Clostridium thermopalmarium DSM 5974]
MIFMICSGIYLLILGLLMAKKKGVSMSKGIGIYNILIGILSLIGGIVAYFLKNIGDKIFFAFTIVLVISFIIFYVLKIVDKNN